MKNKLLPKTELDIHIERTEDELFCARVIHKPTMTIKISDLYQIEEEAVDNAILELSVLVYERRNGLE